MDTLFVQGLGIQASDRQFLPLPDCQPAVMLGQPKIANVWICIGYDQFRAIIYTFILLENERYIQIEFYYTHILFKT
jgi:hypothetical protein